MAGNISNTIAVERFFSGRAKPRPVPIGLDWAVTRAELLFAVKPKRARLLASAGRVSAMQSETETLSDRDLYAAMEKTRQLFRLGREQESDILHALALVSEISFRVRGQRPYPSQTAGALGILQRCIVELAAGEGKTLVAALAAVLIGWRGKGCHVVTANDYLAARDEEEMSGLFRACGLSSASVIGTSGPEERKNAYDRDITYLTSKEAAADFLRDQMALGSLNSHSRMLINALNGGKNPRLTQRGLFCAIVDEADSVLCDGGATPLIISMPRADAPSVEQYLAASAVAEQFCPGVDFRTNIRFREAELTNLGRKKIRQSLQGAGKAWASRSRAVELVLQALEARHFFRNTIHYVVRDGKVVIVDEATGRIMPDHEWRDGIHQAVSAKEGLEVVPPRATCAQTSFQNFFLRYKMLGGMTGTAWEARNEFLQFYNLFVVRIPTHRPCIRTTDYRGFHCTNEEKLRDVTRLAAEAHASGRPVLIGTRSIEASEQVSAALLRANIAHEVLNAVHHDREAEIVALAGRSGTVTVATNMAGRGTDIKLGEGVQEMGGLLVILTEMHASRRIDRQLHGRSGRQGDPGSAAEIICLEDMLFETVPRPLRRFLHLLLAQAGALRRPACALAWKIAALLQWLGDRRALQQRRRMIFSNRKFAEMISYSGKQT
jgi:preprotein translocase subunit SecA